MGMDNLPWVLAYGAKGAAMKLENDYKNKAFDLQKQNTLADNARQESMLGLNKQKFAFDQQKQTAFGQLAAQGMLSPQQIMQGMADGSIDQGTGALALKTAISAQNSNTNLYSKGATADYRNQMHGTTTPLPSGFPGATPMPPGAQRVQPIPMGMGGQPPAPPGGNQIGVSIPDGTGPSEITNAAQQQMQQGAPAGIQMDGTRDQVTEPSRGQQAQPDHIGDFVNREMNSYNTMRSRFGGATAEKFAAKQADATAKANYPQKLVDSLKGVENFSRVVDMVNQGAPVGFGADWRQQFDAALGMAGFDASGATSLQEVGKRLAQAVLDESAAFTSSTGGRMLVNTQKLTELAKGTTNMTPEALKYVAETSVAANMQRTLDAAVRTQALQQGLPYVSGDVGGLVKKITGVPSLFDPKTGQANREAFKKGLSALGLDEYAGVLPQEQSAAPQAQQAAPEGMDANIWKFMTPQEQALWQK